MKRVLRHRLFFVAATVIVVGIACLSYAYFIEPSRLVVNNSTITLKNWDPAFDGLRIVMIGDVHGGSNNVTKEKLREIVAKTNEQDPDIVVFLGDYVSEIDTRSRPTKLKMPIETIADGLSGIKAQHGVFVVLGNHDSFFSDEIVAREFTHVGYRVLQNEVAVIEKDGKRLRIFGLIDHLKLSKRWVETSADLKSIVDSTGEGDLIVLEHSPDILPIITGELLISNDLRLILAAHTHGGQVWFPLFGTPVVPSSYGQKYSYGHVHENDVDMFVTSGIGTSILPIRFMVPPEIRVLTILSEPTS